MATLASSKSNWALITMATASRSETISQMILQVGIFSLVCKPLSSIQCAGVVRCVQGQWHKTSPEFHYYCSKVINYLEQRLSVSAPFISLFSLRDYGICSFSLQYFAMRCILYLLQHLSVLFHSIMHYFTQIKWKHNFVHTCYRSVFFNFKFLFPFLSSLVEIDLVQMKTTQFLLGLSHGHKWMLHAAHTTHW